MSGSRNAQGSTSATTKAGPAKLYPDPSLTPGDVLTADVSKICTPGYTATVRDVSTATKERVYAEYGIGYPQPAGSYEVDHFIPLELGGSNDIKNLWPEPAAPAPGFHQKDQFENYEHAEVCAGALTIEEAQQRMASDWYGYWLQESGTNPGTAIQSWSTSTPSAPVVLDPNNPAVKKSHSDICHERGSTYYDRTIYFTPYDSIGECLASGGRELLPNFGDEPERSGGDLGLRRGKIADDLDPVTEPHTLDQFWQLVRAVDPTPAFLRAIDKLENHGKRRFVR
jgi:hypothetical protein